MGSQLRRTTGGALVWLFGLFVGPLASVIVAAESAAVQEAVTEIKIRMRGTTGTELATLEIGGATVDTWTVLPSFQIYTVSTPLTGAIQLRFLNDFGQQDLQVDYLSINGRVMQAEDQAVNTGVWDDGCGSGGHSEMLHCNGYIAFGSIDRLQSNTASETACEGTCQNTRRGVRLTQN